MKKQNWNDSWIFRKGTLSLLDQLQQGAEKGRAITLPHDAMICEKRTPNTPNGAQTGFYPGGDYEYTKTFFAPEEWQDRAVTVEFEGVYETAMVYVNDALAATNDNGYRGFLVSLDPWLVYGQENTIRVLAQNSAAPNSRWYSGSGIYRPVHLLVGGLVHTKAGSLQIRTPEVSAEYAVVEVEADLSNITRRITDAVLTAELILDGETAVSYRTRITLPGSADTHFRKRIAIETPYLWSPDHPALYTCRLTICADGMDDDATETTFGIRRLTLDAVRGLRINGEPVRLRGACIHHDNGILGAVSLPAAEERRLRLLKEAGFNSVRSSHHPMSPSMLDACDRLGILVMDELTDMWFNHKNPQDYAFRFPENWQKDIAQMVRKDWNHPSVIFYSIGNEIQELGTSFGRIWNRRLADAVHALDPDRYVTNGIHGMIACAGVMDRILPDLMTAPAAESAGSCVREESEKSSDFQTRSQNAAESNAAADGEGEDAGSNGLNQMTDLLVGETGNRFAAHPAVAEAVDECMQPLDVMGYNYFGGRHAIEIADHPQQPLLGSETYPSDMVRLWRDAKAHPHILGDYTWAGYDYLGEAGAGIFYYDGKQNFHSYWPDRTAYVGDLDLSGDRRPQSYLREIVYGLRKTPYIAVRRVNRHGQTHSQNPWMLTDAIASWTWPGYEGSPAIVDVYSDADRVELFLNGVSQGIRPAGEAHGFLATFETVYEPGILTAVAHRAKTLDAPGDPAAVASSKQTDRPDSGSVTRTADPSYEVCILKTAGPTSRLLVTADRTALTADGMDTAFLSISLCDSEENENRFETRTVQVQVEGAARLAGLGNADPQSLGSFDDPAWPTWDGRLLAAVRTGNETGTVRVTVRTDGCPDAVVTLSVTEPQNK